MKLMPWIKHLFDYIFDASSFIKQNILLDLMMLFYASSAW